RNKLTEKLHFVDMKDMTLVENIKNEVDGKALTTAERLQYIYLKNVKNAQAVQSLAIHFATKSFSSSDFEEGAAERYDLYQFPDGSALALPLFEHETRPSLVFKDFNPKATQPTVESAAA